MPDLLSSDLSSLHGKMNELCSKAKCLIENGSYHEVLECAANLEEICRKVWNAGGMADIGMVSDLYEGLIAVVPDNETGLNLIIRDNLNRLYSETENLEFLASNLYESWRYSYSHGLYGKSVKYYRMMVEAEEGYGDEYARYSERESINAGLREIYEMKCGEDAIVEHLTGK